MNIRTRFVYLLMENNIDGITRYNLYKDPANQINLLSTILVIHKELNRIYQKNSGALIRKA